MPKKVLIVDDSLHYLAILSELFQDEKHVVVEADSGESALDKIRAGFIPDAAIIDLHMAGMNGLDLIKEINREYDIKIFLHTSEPNIEPLVAGIPNVTAIEKGRDGIRTLIEALK